MLIKFENTATKSCEFNCYRIVFFTCQENFHFDLDGLNAEARGDLFLELLRNVRIKRVGQLPFFVGKIWSDVLV